MAPNSLVTTVVTPRKWPGRIGPSSRSASAPGSTCVSKPAGYIDGGGGCVHGVDAGVAAGRQVVVDRAGVVVEVGGLVELERVDEDRHHHHVGTRARLGDERQVPVVERAHRRHDADDVAVAGTVERPGAHRLGAVEHLHGGAAYGIERYALGHRSR